MNKDTNHVFFSYQFCGSKSWINNLVSKILLCALVSQFYKDGNKHDERKL